MVKLQLSVIHLFQLHGSNLKLRYRYDKLLLKILKKNYLSEVLIDILFLRIYDIIVLIVLKKTLELFTNIPI